MIDSRYPTLSALAKKQIAEAPDQEKFFTRRIGSESDDGLERLEELAIHVSKLISHDEAAFFRDYAWLCGEQLNEELHFRRHGSYRYSTFEEAVRAVYSDHIYMTRYMNGLLMTQLWWKNHSDVIGFYRKAFLQSNPAGCRHLEIGPGHGLFAYFASADERTGTVTCWDISRSSIELTRNALLNLGLEELPSLELQNFFSAPGRTFDSIVFSEVLEHMEKPGEALERLHGLLSRNGRLFLNMPINSPAPDHLFNVDCPEALESFIKEFGFTIDDKRYFPATNQTLEAARKKKLTISCAFIARRL